MTFTLTNCSGIITGASSGLGAEFARQLAPTAKLLLLVARREEALNQVKVELLAKRADLQVHLCVADVVRHRNDLDLALLVRIEVVVDAEAVGAGVISCWSGQRWVIAI
jgi:short-subunit dehydrogenase